MHRIPDIIILLSVIVGAASIGIGYRTVGVTALAVAMVVGWKRNWCIGALEEMVSSSKGSVVNRAQHSHADSFGGTIHSGDSDVNDGGGDGD